jgi:hypothetical protein
MARLRKPTSSKTVACRSPRYQLGRPPIEDALQALELNLWVDEQASRTGRSVHAICKSATYEYVIMRSDRPRYRTLAGASLARRYYEGKALLQKEINELNEQRAWFASVGATFHAMPDEPQLVTFYKVELARRLS